MAYAGDDSKISVAVI